MSRGDAHSSWVRRNGTVDYSRPPKKPPPLGPSTSPDKNTNPRESVHIDNQRRTAFRFLGQAPPGRLKFTRCSESSRPSRAHEMPPTHPAPSTRLNRTHIQSPADHTRKAHPALVELG